MHNAPPLYLHRVRNVEGSIRVNGSTRSLQTFRKIQAYIMQDDHLLPHLSVDEAMMAAANLKLGPGFSHHGRRQVVSRLEIVREEYMGLRPDLI